MGLPRKIVEVARHLPTDPFSPGAADTLAETPVIAALLVDISRATSSPAPKAEMLLILQCLAILQSETKSNATRN